MQKNRFRFSFGLFDSVDKSYDILTPVSYDRISISSTILYIQSLFKDSQLDLSMPNLQLWRFPPRFASADFESDGNFNFEDTELWKLWWCFRIWCKEVGSSWFASLEHVELRNLQWLHFFSALPYPSLQFAMQWMFFLQVRCEKITGKYWFSANVVDFMSSRGWISHFQTFVRSIDVFQELQKKLRVVADQATFD